MKPTTDYATFEALDIRVGRVLDVAVARTRKPTYRLTIDFGPELGTRQSCAGLRSYEPEQLVGRLVVAVINFPPRQMGSESSEVLVLGVPDDAGDVIVLTPESEVPRGAAVY